MAGAAAGGSPLPTVEEAFSIPDPAQPTREKPTETKAISTRTLSRRFNWLQFMATSFRQK
jgi:hypothetical protein